MVLDPGAEALGNMEWEGCSQVASPSSMVLGKAAGLGSCCSSGAQARLHLFIVGSLCLLPSPRCLGRHKAEDGKIKGSLSLWVLQSSSCISAALECQKECWHVKEPHNTQLSLPGMAGPAA